jgi:hypothetical protein
MKKLALSLLASFVLVGLCLAQSSTSSPDASPVQRGTTESQAPAGQSAEASGESLATGKIAPGTVIPAELAKSVDAKKAKSGDQVLAKLAQDMLSNGQVIIARGAKIVGHVTQAKPREKGESESSLGIAFDKLLTKDGRELPLNASIQAVGAPASNFNTNNGPSGNGPMSESGGMPGGMGGSASAGMGGAGGRSGGSATGAPGNPGGNAGGNYPEDTGNSGSQSGTRGALQPGATGVVGISGLNLSAGSDGSSVITSQNKNVKLDSGTQLMLRVNGK